MEVNLQKMFSILQVEKRKKDQRYLPCTIKLMGRLVLENKNIEITFGQSLKLNIDLALQKRKFLKEQVFHSILKE